MSKLKINNKLTNRVFINNQVFRDNVKNQCCFKPRSNLNQIVELSRQDTTLKFNDDNTLIDNVKSFNGGFNTGFNINEANNFGYKDWLDIMLNSKNNCEDSKYKCKESKSHPVLELTLVESYYLRRKEIQGGHNVISKNNFNLNTKLNMLFKCDIFKCETIFNKNKYN